MKNNTRKILLGLSLLGVTMTGFSPSASAKSRDKDVKEARKDVKEARKDVKKARKDVRKADSPEERRDAREDLRGEQRDLREEKRENRPNYRRPTYVRPTYNRPNYGRPNYGRPNYGRPNYSNSNRNEVRGVVTQDLEGNSFLVRTSSGRIVRVVATQGESYSISRGDTIRASGSYSGNSFNGSSVSIVRNR